MSVWWNRQVLLLNSVAMFFFLFSDGVKVLATTSVATLGFLDVSTRKYSTLMRSHTDVYVFSVFLFSFFFGLSYLPFTSQTVTSFLHLKVVQKLGNAIVTECCIDEYYLCDLYWHLLKKYPNLKLWFGTLLFQNQGWMYGWVETNFVHLFRWSNHPSVGYRFHETTLWFRNPWRSSYGSLLPPLAGGITATVLFASMLFATTFKCYLFWHKHDILMLLFVAISLIEST